MRKYKVGQKVRMIAPNEPEYKFCYDPKLRKKLKEHDYVFTIIGLFMDKYYDMKEDPGAFQDIHIKEVYDDIITSRFEILDI